MADKKKNYSKKAGGKGLMAAISDYQKEKKSGPHRPGAVKGQGPVADGATYGKLLKKNKQEDSRGPVGVRAPKQDPPPQQQRQEKPPRTTKPETHSAHNRTPTTPYRSRAQGLNNVKKEKDKAGNNSNNTPSNNSGRPRSSAGTTDKTRKPGYYTVPGKGRRYWNGKKWTMTQAGSNPMYGQAKRGLKSVAESLWGKDK